jgi:transcriptional regulator with XRE-family HTH domain
MLATDVQEWCKALNKQRRALKMTLRSLAERAKVSRATVCRVLKGETAACSFQSVLAIAHALGANFQLTMKDPEELVEQQVQKRAKKIVEMVQGTMALESQGITDPNYLSNLVEIAAREIRAKPRKQLWMNQCRSSSQMAGDGAK